MSRFVDAKGRELYDQSGVWQRREFVLLWDLPMQQGDGVELAYEVEE